MMLELAVLSGSASGTRERFGNGDVSLGRHPDSDLRFDPHRDLDVSLRHARIHVEEETVLLEDLGSTNGTFLNGRRVERPTPLRDEDVISLGSEGPRVSVRILPTDTASLPSTEVHRVRQATPPVNAAPRSAERAWRTPLVAAVVVLVLAATAALSYAAGRADANRREAHLLELSRRTDSLIARYNDDLSSMAGQVQGLDSALRTAQQESRSLRGELQRMRVSGGGGGEGVETMSNRLERAELRQRSLATLSRLDYSAIAEQSGRAVVLIAVEDANGQTMTGTGFGVSRGGLIVTNKHLVQTQQSPRPRRVAVIFSDTPVWHPARVVRVSESSDLAVLQVESPGPFPVVAGISRRGSLARVGSPVAIIGYPLGTDTPMESGRGDSFTARYTLGAGTLSKGLADVLQIDAFAGEGSSGSPVFDADGLVIGVVYGGARESAGRIVYAVPSDLLADLLPRDAAALLR
jgi:S1-C subfamily serine protease